jgi:hypothetical protein
MKDTFIVNPDLSSSDILDHATLKTQGIAAQLSLLLSDGEGETFCTNHSEIISIIYGIQTQVEQVEQLVIQMHTIGSGGES